MSILTRSEQRSVLNVFTYSLNRCAEYYAHENKSIYSLKMAIYESPTPFKETADFIKDAILKSGDPRRGHYIGFDHIMRNRPIVEKLLGLTPEAIEALIDDAVEAHKHLIVNSRNHITTSTVNSNAVVTAKEKPKKAKVPFGDRIAAMITKN